MNLEGGITFFIAIFIFGITPGPGIFALLGRAIAFNAKSCFPLALGMTLSDIVYLTMACFGLAAIAENWNTAFTVIRLVGAAYLMYLGWKMWTSPAEPVKNESNSLAYSWPALLLQGILISASNPKVILFYIAFLPTFMDLSTLQAGDIVIAAALTLFALVSGLMLVAYGAGRARLVFRSTRAMKQLNRIAGSIMAGAGVYLATRQ
jgi:threonine/homoserine/homoserine lactone efflux protein